MEKEDFKIKFKHKKDQFIHPIILALDKMGFTADRATLLSVIFGLAAVYFLFKNDYLFIGLIFRHFLFDSLDGSLARYQKKPYEPKGIWFDFMADRIVIFALLIKASTFDHFYLWSLGLYFILQLIFIVFFLRKKAEYIKEVYIIDALIIGAFIIKVSWLVPVLIVITYLMNVVALLSVKNHRPITR